MNELQRRGFQLGAGPSGEIIKNDPDSNWNSGFPVKIHGICADTITKHQEAILKTEQLVLNILEGESAYDLLSRQPYFADLTENFNFVGSYFNEGDEQEIETVLFDKFVHTDTVTEDLWMKVSWLSFYENDASLRFRFSFGVDLIEDVAADEFRQKASADLAETVFPESKIITENTPLIQRITRLLDGQTPQFVERILYFNAPDGGAYLHHDLERGHAGVVYAQVTGATCWLALPKAVLVNEIQAFIKQSSLPNSLNDEQRHALQELAIDRILISNALDSFNHDGLIHLINETEEFVQILISKGHARVVNPGDVILLPQSAKETCCWHSVFCLGDEMGQALSFAIK